MHRNQAPKLDMSCLYGESFAGWQLILQRKTHYHENFRSNCRRCCCATYCISLCSPDRQLQVALDSDEAEMHLQLDWKAIAAFISPVRSLCKGKLQPARRKFCTRPWSRSIVTDSTAMVMPQGLPICLSGHLINLGAPQVSSGM